MTVFEDRPVYSTKKIRIEDALYLLAFGIALLMRVAILGRGMLNGYEAGFAWQAYQAAQGAEFQILGHPGYVLGTGLLFYIFGSGEVLARLLPALAGSAVILYPFVLRDKLGKRAALAAAFGLALDPLLVAFSRQAGSPVMALGFLALALYCYQKEWMVATGIFSGLVLLSGESLVVGGLFFLLGWLFTKFVGGRSFSKSFQQENLPQVLIGGGIALLVFGTLFLRYPQGLSAMLQSVPNYFAGWTRSAGAASGVPAAQILVALLVYQPFAVLFGGIALVNRRTFEQPLYIFLAGGLLGSLIVILLDPSRQIWMLVWLLLPFWLLAGSVLGKFFYLPSSKDRLFVAGEVIFFLVLLAYWWFNLARMTQLFFVNIPPGTGLFDFQALDSTTRIYLVRFVVLVFIPLLILLMTGIARYAWKGKAPMQGAIWSVGLFLVFYLLMTAWNFTAQPERLAGELWVQGPAAGHPEEVRAALEEASVQITGSKDQLALVYQIDSPLLHWLLRDFPNAEFQPVELQNELPDVVLNQKIDAGGEDLLTQFYRGQRIPFQLDRNWDGALPPDFDRWLVYREAPVSKDWIVIWTRADVFPLYAPQPED